MIKSYSKINLFLKVLKKNQNGLHIIQSSVMLLNLYDKINIKNTNKNLDEIHFTGQFKNNINIKNNSITKSLKILRKYGLINKSCKYKIVVEKKILQSNFNTVSTQFQHNTQWHYIILYYIILYYIILYYIILYYIILYYAILYYIIL